MIDPLDKILDKLNNDELLSDISDDENNNENNNENKEEIEKMREKILETYNEVKKCCIEIFMGYLILIDTNNTLIEKNHDNMDYLENKIEINDKLDIYDKNKIKLQRLNKMYFSNLINDLNNDNILNIPEFIKLLTRKLDHNLECFIKLLELLLNNILNLEIKWDLSSNIDILDYNGKLLINELNSNMINLYLKYITHNCK